MGRLGRRAQEDLTITFQGTITAIRGSHVSQAPSSVSLQAGSAAGLLLRPVDPYCYREERKRHGVGRQSPPAGAQVPVEAEGARRGQGRKKGNGLQQRHLLRCEAGSLPRQQEDDDPGSDEADGQRDRRAHDDSEQYGQRAHALYRSIRGFPPLLSRTAGSSLDPSRQGCHPFASELRRQPEATFDSLSKSKASQLASVMNDA